MMAIKMNGTIGTVLFAKNNFIHVIDFVDNNGFIGGADGFDSLAIHD